MKSELRQSMKKKRAKLSVYEVLQKSKEVISNLKNLEEFSNASDIMLYVSTNNEVFTHDLIKELINGKNIYVPLVKGGEIIVSKLNSFDELKEGNFNVLEPEEEFVRVVEPDKLDIIVVPGLVFDKEGNRIGYGKGFYDKFLKNTNALKIGLCFDFQIVDKIESESFDVKLDKIIKN